MATGTVKWFNTTRDALRLVREGRCMHPSVKAQQKLALLRVACRIKKGAIPILRLPGLIDCGCPPRCSGACSVFPHQCECHDIRTLDADEAREDLTVGIPHRLDFS
jgi:hypothetical protein